MHNKSIVLAISLIGKHITGLKNTGTLVIIDVAGDCNRLHLTLMFDCTVKT
jgi:hypothetical protein